MSDSNKSVCMNCMLGDIDCTCIEPRKRELSSPFQEKIMKLKAENARYRKALEYISEASWVDHPEISNAIDGDYLGDHFSEIAREALKGE